MANKVFGEARLPLADGRELTLRFDFNAMCEIEEAAGQGTESIMEAVAKGNPRLKVARAMLYGGLRFYHRDLGLDDVGDLFLTDRDAVNEAMGRAMEEFATRQAAANPLPGPRAVKAAPRPRGIGTLSSKSGAKAA